MGPESRGSKNSFWPNKAAAGESRYLFVVSTGKFGNGESVLMTAHSCGEKKPSGLPDWPQILNIQAETRITLVALRMETALVFITTSWSGRRNWIPGLLHPNQGR